MSCFAASKENEMNRKRIQVLILSAFGLLVAGMLQAAAGPTDFDLKLIPAKKTVRPGDDLAVDAVIAVRQTGVQGWSYGVKHDAKYLDVISATTVGSNVPSVFSAGFDQTVLIQENGTNVGWIQAIILSFQEDKQLPINPQFVMAKSQYKVKNGICTTDPEIRTSIAYVDKELAVPNSPAVEINLTVGGDSVVPAVWEAADLVIQCPTGGLDLKLIAEATENRKLVGDKSDVLKINLSLANNSATDGADVQGWSYGLKLDPAVLAVSGLTASPATLALNSGNGPDFLSYSCPSCPPSIEDGKSGAKGITVGAVVSIDPPYDILVIPAGQSKILEILSVKSAIEIPVGGSDVVTQLDFVSEMIPSDRPVESIIVVNGASITPKSDSPSITVTVTQRSLENKFRRGDANNDGRVDIADGINIILQLFFQSGVHIVCQKAADTNDDGRVDLSDAVYNFNYYLQPGKKSGDVLYPKPPAPFPGCGQDTATPDSLTCTETTTGCQQ
jgi:hypothetical protein